MRRALGPALVLASLMATPTPTQAETMTGNSFFELCSSTASDQARLVCQMYTIGLTEGILVGARGASREKYLF